MRKRKTQTIREKAGRQKKRKTERQKREKERQTDRQTDIENRKLCFKH